MNNIQIPTEDLDQSNAAVTTMVQTIRDAQARGTVYDIESMALQLMNMHSTPGHPLTLSGRDGRLQNLALLLAVALQRLTSVT